MLCKGLSAERTRFELVIRLPVCRFSKPVDSATLPPLQCVRLKVFVKPFRQNRIANLVKLIRIQNMLKGIDPDFRHDDGVIVQGDEAVFGAVRRAKCPKFTPNRCSGPCGVQKIQREGLSTRRRAW